MFPFSSKIYKYLKWIAAIVLPALTALVGTVGLTLAWSSTDKVVIIIAAVNTFLGALVGVSSSAYGKQEALLDEQTRNGIL
jgi:hypothetical protein